MNHLWSLAPNQRFVCCQRGQDLGSSKCIKCLERECSGAALLSSGTELISGSACTALRWRLFLVLFDVWTLTALWRALARRGYNFLLFLIFNITQREKGTEWRQVCFLCIFEQRRARAQSWRKESFLCDASCSLRHAGVRKQLFLKGRNRPHIVVPSPNWIECWQFLLYLHQSERWRCFWILSNTGVGEIFFKDGPCIFWKMHKIKINWKY